MTIRILNWGSSVGNRTIDTTGTFLVPETDAERFTRGVSAGSLVPGGRYQIQSVGTTDWTTAGAPNNTIDTIFTATGSATGTGKAGLFLPSNLQGKNNYGLGFNFTIDPASGDGAFLLGDDGLKISSGTTSYKPPTVTTSAGQFEIGGKYTIASVNGTDFTLVGAPNNNILTTFTATGNGADNGSGSATSDGRDYLYAIGYPPGILSGGIYANALDLSTLRLGNGNDLFSVIGTGITQAVRASVSIDSSLGYIFQSNIFAGSGDDTLRVLMPWQSTFKGGTNTVYYDGNLLGPINGIGVILDDELTLEEVPYGDLIELKGSRFDWDIEFKDGNGDGKVTLESILDERDYIVAADNNKISGFERIQFGDILFDLVLYRQQQSSAVYGQPDYYLNGAESLAPELNSDIASGSELWEAFRFNRIQLQGITGTATNNVDVFTGNAKDTPFLSGALLFASLNTEGGDDIVLIGSADQASLNLGIGADQIEVKGLFDKSLVDGGADADNIILNIASAASVLGGAGADVIQVRTSAANTSFDAGADLDRLVLPGTLASYGLSYTVDGAGVVTFRDGSGNTYTSFETYVFADATLTDVQLRNGLDNNQLFPLVIKLVGETAIDEGLAASYAVSLDGVSLPAGRSATVTLDTSGFSSTTLSFSATEGTDFVALVASSLEAANGLALGPVSTDPESKAVTVTVSNNSTSALSVGSQLLTFKVATTEDLSTEANETFGVTLASTTATVSTAELTTTVVDNDPALRIRLEGVTSVTEGQSAAYAVVLDGVGLSAGRSVSFQLDTAPGTASDGVDYDALLSSFVQDAPGLALSAVTTDPVSKAVSLTVTNSGSSELASGSQLVSFSIPTKTDLDLDPDETFVVSLASSRAAVTVPSLTTTITNLSGGASGGGGAGGGGGGGGGAIPITPTTTIAPAPLPGGGSFVTANPLKTGTQDLVGSDQGDVVTGSFGPDKLAGGLGVDQLSGGLGSDVFALTFADPAADILIDFTPGEDKILVNGVQPSSKLGRFLKGGSESSKVLATVSSAKTATRSKRLYAYDEQTGNLYFNANGAKKGFGSGGGLVAELPPLLDLAPTDLQFSYI